MTGIVLAGLLWGVCARAADVSTHALGAKKQSLSTSTDSVNAGYYSATWLSAVDTALSGSNIKSGVSIFGISGGYYGVARTGQTTVYHYPSGNDLGDDGAIQAGFSDTRFTVHGSTVTDNATQLTWVKCTIGQSASDCSGGSASWLGWEDAFSAVADLNASNFADHNDWRMPNVKELQSLVDYEKSPAIDAAAFPNTVSSDYWTSTTYLMDTGLHWLISFYDGLVGYTNSSMFDSHFARAVRGP